jgi:GNAT superfamily N-acetyltransferase
VQKHPVFYFFLFLRIKKKIPITTIAAASRTFSHSIGDGPVIKTAVGPSAPPIMPMDTAFVSIFMFSPFLQKTPTVYSGGFPDFEKKRAEVMFPCVDGEPVGYALFFHNFSTFLGRAGIYLEDLCILPEYRGKGYGKATLKKLAQITVERGCGRLEWCCLDWNQPSIDFYLSLGAEQLSEWTTYRLTGDTLKKVAE